MKMDDIETSLLIVTSFTFNRFEIADNNVIIPNALGGLLALAQLGVFFAFSGAKTQMYSGVPPSHVKMNIG